MITLIAKLTVKQGKMEEAKAILKELVPRIREEEPGCLEYVPHTVKGEENMILFYEKYRDKDALKIHGANLGKNFEKLSPLMEPGMDIKYCYSILESRES